MKANRAIEQQKADDQSPKDFAQRRKALKCLIDCPHCIHFEADEAGYRCTNKEKRLRLDDCPGGIEVMFRGQTLAFMPEELWHILCTFKAKAAL